MHKVFISAFHCWLNPLMTDGSSNSHLHNVRFVPFYHTVYASQDMEKDNKSLPLRVFSNTMSSFPIDTKSSKATTSLLQISQQSTLRHPVHPRLTDVQICPNEIIDLTSAAVKEKQHPVNLSMQTRPYELTKLSSNMMNIYDVNSQSLDILKGISKG